MFFVETRETGCGLGNHGPLRRLPIGCALLGKRGAAREDVVSLGFEIRVQESRGDEGISDDVRSRIFHRFESGHRISGVQPSQQSVMKLDD